MNEERMSKKPVIVDSNGTQKLERVLLNSKTFQEKWMQELLEKEPNILPTGNIDSIFAPLICIAREVETPSGFIDNLYISSKGYLVIVETKLWRNPEARREVVGQILDYAKDVKEWDYEKLDSIYRKNHNNSLFNKMLEMNYQTSDNESNFIDIVEKNIKNARFLLMIVGDGIREGVERMTEFLNNTPNMQYRFALCELEVYDLGNNKRLVIPQLTTKTRIIERGIIRIEETSKNVIDITMHEPNEEKESKQSNNKKYAKSDYLSLDEWLNKTFENTEMENEFSELLQDFKDLGFIYNIGVADMILSYDFETYKTKVKMLQVYGDGKSIVFQPIKVYNFLETYGFSSKIADELYEAIKKYLSPNQKNLPYERLNGYYYMDVAVVLENKNELLQVFEKFKSNF